MKKFTTLTPAVGVALAAVTLGACSSTTSASSAGSQADTSGPVTIRVGNMPTADKPVELAAFNKRVSEFEQANPDIKVTGVAAEYDATTFQAQLAGGTLPDMISVPFTDVQGLIDRQQAADLTSALDDAKVTAQLNPDTLKVAKGKDGKIYGVPQQAYTMGLFYNRSLFTKAGLDPDKPPTTWSQVRQDAKTIADKTGVKGFSMPTADNAGGWLFTAAAYSYGGTVESPDGKQATVNSAVNAKALDTLRAMKNQDKSMGNDVVVKWDPWLKNFAAGKAGMQLGAPDMYLALVVQNGMKASDLGMAAMPQADGQHGSLGGGTVLMANPKTSARTRQALVKWAEFSYLRRYTNQQAAVEQAKADRAGKVPVGLPMLSPVAASSQRSYNSWIRP